MKVRERKFIKPAGLGGGQFADLNNDGYLDIYVTAGYFTAPSIYDTNKDL